MKRAMLVAFLIIPAIGSLAQAGSEITQAPPDCPAKTLSCGLSTESILPDGVCLSGCNEHAELWRIHVFVQTTLVTVTASSAEIDPRLDLLDADGRLIASNDNSGGTPDARIAEVLSPGEYFVVAAAQPAGSEGRYTIAMRCLLSDAKNFCIPDAETLCLASRFSFRVRAIDPGTGAPIAATPRPQTELYGFFSLPSLTGNRDNPEVFVKLIDGRSVNGRWWIFWGGLTGLDYEIVVTDRFKRLEKRYRGHGSDTTSFGESQQAPLESVLKHP
jgi:hypothetical protein